jgi:hypothetical protein
VGTDGCIDMVSDSIPFNPALPFDCVYIFVICSAVVLVDGVDAFPAEPVAAESHLDGAVARKNLSRSR